MQKAKGFFKKYWSFLVVIVLTGAIIAQYTGPVESGLIAQGVTNFGTVTTSDDVNVGDDLSVGDDAAVTGDLDITGATSFAASTVTGTITQAQNIENLGALPTMLSVDIDIDNDSSPFTCATVADGEVWVVHAVFANVLDNWATGGSNDAVLDVGDGNVATGFLDLNDAELQVADTEGTGGAAGWQGFLSTDVIGAYVAEGVPFIYAPSGAAETIDCAFAGTGLASDTADTDPDITIYIFYSRIQ